MHFSSWCHSWPKEHTLKTTLEWKLEQELEFQVTPGYITAEKRNYPAGRHSILPQAKLLDGFSLFLCTLPCFQFFREQNSVRIFWTVTELRSGFLLCCENDTPAELSSFHKTLQRNSWLSKSNSALRGRESIFSMLVSDLGIITGGGGAETESHGERVREDSNEQRKWGR